MTIYARRLTRSTGRVTKDDQYEVTINQRGVPEITDQNGRTMYITPHPEYWELTADSNYEYGPMNTKFDEIIRQQAPQVEARRMAEVLFNNSLVSKELRAGVTQLDPNPNARRFAQYEGDSMKIEKVILVNNKRADEMAMDTYLSMIKREQDKLEALKGFPASKTLNTKRTSLQTNINNLVTLMDRYCTGEE